MMSFAYEMESSGGLYAMSVAEKDFGKVYFYYDEYYYSVRVRKYMLEKHGYCYYDQKIKTILEKYSIDLNKITAIQLSHRLIPGVIIDEVDNLPPECIFELERANFIPIADSFTDFINKLFVEKI
ncbi:hypothetical protein NFHSH190041_21950 [Shewanella sp. NFH-SH190041]|nr:hypothetical protein NFHSH190041_21950 [Shewanella sp. NFH-SH190041]